MLKEYNEERCKGCDYLVDNGEGIGVCDIWSSANDDCPLLTYECPICGKSFHEDEMVFSYDCHGIPFRRICCYCWNELLETKGYDGEYYTELDECIDWDY